MTITTNLDQRRKRKHKRFPLREFLLTMLIFPSLSMTWTDTHRSLLSERDFLLEDSKDRPALSSAIWEHPGWESFHEWQCYPAEQIELNCAIHTFPGYGGRTYEKKTPSLRITTEAGEILDFDYDDFGSFNIDCNSTLKEWRRILEEESALCLYAAYLQDIAEGQTYWILEKMKTSQGYWPSSYSRESMVEVSPYVSNAGGDDD